MEVEDNQLITRVHKINNMATKEATIIEDVKSLGTLFSKCSFHFAQLGRINRITELSKHALSIWVDEEWTIHVFTANCTFV